MADGAESKAAQDAAWWAEWRQWDFTWPGLAREEFAGWSVRDGLLVETESGRVYGAPEAAAREGEADPAGESRPATLQDYWRADPATGRLRGDAELIAAGELLFRPSPLVGEGGPQGRMRGAGEALEAGANTPHPARTASSPPSPTRPTGCWCV
jgi:hypothetical protein